MSSAGQSETSRSRPPHDSSALGLPVITDMPADVLEPLSLCPQPIRSVPSVEYLPYPHLQ